MTAAWIEQPASADFPFVEYPGAIGTLTETQGIV